MTGFKEVFLPRGIAQDLLDHPEILRCWCGATFQKKAANQIHCSGRCKRLASIIRSLLPNMPPPAIKREPKATPVVRGGEEGNPTGLDSKNKLENAGQGD